MKRIIVSACLLLTLSCGLPLLEQAQQRHASRSARKKHTATNKPPVIKSFTPSASTAIIPCPWDKMGVGSPPDSLELNLTTNASDPDSDTLLYKYIVTGGRIIGEGTNVQWNLTGTMPGSYMAKVIVDDQHGGMAFATTNVEVAVSGACDPPCTVLSLSSPKDIEEGQPLIISVSVEGGDSALKPTYKWSVSAGTIIKGQGTPTIEIDTTGLAEKRVTATVDVGGIPPTCQRTISCEVQINKR